MAKKPVKKEGPSGLDTLKADLKTGQYGRLYLFYGEEHYLRDHYLQMLQNKLLDGPAKDFNFHRFTQETVDLQELADAVDALPMMAQSSLVQVEDWDLSKLHHRICVRHGGIQDRRTAEKTERGSGQGPDGGVWPPEFQRTEYLDPSAFPQLRQGDRGQTV